MAIQTSECRWTVFRAGQPLVTRSANGEPKALALLKTSHVTHLLGDKPFFGQGESPGEESVASDASVLEACRLRGHAIVFLGLKESEGTQGLPSSEFRTPETADDIAGAPYFSLDITGVSETVADELVRSAAEGGETLKFEEPRSATTSFGMIDGSVFAVARSMLDWNTRNKVHSDAFTNELACHNKLPSVLRRVRLADLFAVGRVETFMLVPFPMGEQRRQTAVSNGVGSFSLLTLAPAIDPSDVCLERGYIISPIRERTQWL